MTHYETLGVSPSATAAEIRRAYLALARAQHPDLQADPQDRADAEGEMRRLNAAWAVLRDDERRRRYDAELGPGSAPGPAQSPAPAPPWRPLVDDDTDYAALLDDTPMTGARAPRWLQLLPAVLLLFGLLLVAIGLVAGSPSVAAAGVVELVVAGLSFLAAPAFVIFTSRDDGDG